jgi:hypothetical protein
VGSVSAEGMVVPFAEVVGTIIDGEGHHPIAVW